MFWGLFWIVYIWFAVCAFIALNSARKIDRLVYRSFGLADCVLWAVLWPRPLYIILNLLWSKRNGH